MLRATDDEFDAMVTRAIEDLPADLAVFLERVPVIVDQLPGPELRDLEDGPPQPGDSFFGLFVGPPLAEWDTPDAPPETACIFLYRRPLLEHCLTLDELEREVRTTLYHELGHALGFGEEDMERLGLE